jgi:predicted nucleotidyltransferase
MKIETAIRHANEVARRVREVNGLLATPLCRHEAVRIRRIWVFGSTVKGSNTPNDLDLLIDIEEAGRIFTAKQTKIDKQYFRRYSMRRAPCTINEALKWLTKGMKMVSRHTLRNEAADIDVKVLIYPRNDLSKFI